MAENANISNAKNKINLIFVLAIINIILLAALLIFFITKGGGNNSQSGIHPDVLRDAGNKLKAVGLSEQAIELYELYLNNETLGITALSNISFSLADLYIKDSNYKEGLKWLYIVESLDENYSNKDELNKKIVMCLEKSGKENAAEYALQARSQLGGKGDEAKKAGDVIATIGAETITLNEINEAIERLPDWVKKKYDNPEEKLEFAKRYIADELLYKKGVKLNYDKDEEIKVRIRDFIKGLVANKVVEKEIKSKIGVQDDDLNNFFIANKSFYDTSEKAKISMIKTDNEKDVKKALKKLKSGAKFSKAVKLFSNDPETREKGGKVDFVITKGDSYLTRVGPSTKANEAIFSTSAGEITGIIKVEDNYVIIRVDERMPAKEADFNDLKEKIKSDYFSQKFTGEYQKMIDNLISVTNTKIYLEKVK